MSAEGRTLGNLIERVVKAQRNLGPRNPYRLLLAECLAVIRFLGDELVKANQARIRAGGLTRVADEGTDATP